MGPVALFAANAFGLHAMHGNVWEWVEDCYHDNYNGAPTDGSAWTTGDCNRRVIRSGSWKDDLQRLRSASRRGYPVVTLDDCSGCFFNVGFRVGRTLTP